MVLVKSFAQVVLPSDPAGVLQAGTKQYIDAADALKAPLASPTFTGTAAFVKQVNTPVTLTDAATVAIDANLGNTFRLTMTSGVGATRALGNPTNATDGQMILIEVIQDVTGSRLLTYGTNYAFGSLVTSPTLTTTASKTDFLGFMYNSTAGKWRMIAFAPGY